MNAHQLYKRLATDTDQAFSACTDLVFQGKFIQHRNCVGEGLVGGAIYACNSAGGQQMMQLARPLLKSGHGSLLFLLFDSAAANMPLTAHTALHWTPKDAIIDVVDAPYCCATYTTAL